MLNKTNLICLIGILFSITLYFIKEVSYPTAIFAILYFTLEMAKRDTNRKLIDKKIVTTSDKHKLAHLI